MSNKIKIATCQPIEILEDVGRAIKTIKEYSIVSESKGALFICFPECFLQGYIVNEKTSNLAIDLQSPEFEEILIQFSDINITIIFGMIEKEEQNIYNSAVIVKKGALIGVYRKTKLIGSEFKVFEPGNKYPAFKMNGIIFGINICYDTNFGEGAKTISEEKADILFCPSNNMLSFRSAELWKNKHNIIRSNRAIESGLWLISSDVIGKRNDKISFGSSAIINPEGKIMAQLPESESGILIQEITLKQWKKAYPVLV